MPSINQSSSATKVVVALAMAALLFAGWRTLGSGASEYKKFTYDYYYDLETQKIFVDNKYLVPPIRNGAAVKVVVLSCSSCDDKDSKNIGWLEKYDDQVQKMIQQSASDDPASEPVSERQRQAVSREMIAGQLIAPDPKTTGNQVQWVLANSPEGEAVKRTTIKKCGKSTKFCSPGIQEVP